MSKKIIITLLAIVLASASFAQINPLTIGSIDAGDSIIIYYNVKIDNPFPASRIATKGNVSGGNFATVTTDDPGTGTAGDSTYTDVVNNVRPQFVNGASTSLGVAYNTLTALNSTLQVTEPDAGQTMVWSILSGPTNGSLNGFTYSTSATGSTLTPSGLSYTPTSTYYGSDAVSIRIYDGSEYDTIQINITVANPGIHVKGNGTTPLEITDGDATPSTADSTNFGTRVINTSLVRRYTIENTSASTLTITNIQASGTNSGEFVVGTAPTSIAPSASATFIVTFTPTATGTRVATITVNSDNTNIGAYDFAVQGNGINTYTYSGPGNWTNQGNWFPSYPGLTIPSGIIIDNPSGTLTVNAAVVNNGTMNNNGTLLISGGSFTNNGTYEGTGTYTGAVFVNPASGVVSPGD